MLWYKVMSLTLIVLSGLCLGLPSGERSGDGRSWTRHLNLFRNSNRRSSTPRSRPGGNDNNMTEAFSQISQPRRSIGETPFRSTGETSFRSTGETSFRSARSNFSPPPVYRDIEVDTRSLRVNPLYVKRPNKWKDNDKHWETILDLVKTGQIRSYTPIYHFERNVANSSPPPLSFELPMWFMKRHEECFPGAQFRTRGQLNQAIAAQNELWKDLVERYYAGLIGPEETLPTIRPPQDVYVPPALIRLLNDGLDLDLNNLLPLDFCWKQEEDEGQSSSSSHFS